MLALDAAAFPRDWRLGPELASPDALGATPVAPVPRARATPTTITGYAITGLAGRHGYLQRIATDPARRRAGIGRALVADAFAYLWSRGVIARAT